MLDNHQNAKFIANYLALNVGAPASVTAAHLEASVMQANL